MRTIKILALGILLPLMFACGSATKTDALDSQVDSQDSNTRVSDRTPSTTNLPDQLIVTAKFKETPAPGSVEDDDGNLVVFLMANITNTVYSVELHDFLNLAKASSHTFVNPVLTGCILTTYSFDYIGPANEILNFGGKDIKGTSACQDFFKAIRNTGLQMRFTDVPLLNGNNGVIKDVVINITNP